MNNEIATLKNQTMVMRSAIADKAISIVEEYRQGKHHGREVSMILGELFESANDTFEKYIVEKSAENKTIPIEELPEATTGLCLKCRTLLKLDKDELCCPNCGKKYRKSFWNKNKNTTVVFGEGSSRW